MMWLGMTCAAGWFAVTWITLASMEREFEAKHGRRMRGRESSFAIIVSMLWFLALPCLIGMMIDGDNEKKAKK